MNHVTQNHKLTKKEKQLKKTSSKLQDGDKHLSNKHVSGKFSEINKYKFCSISSHSRPSGKIARRLRAKFRPDCAIPDTSMKFVTVVDHD